MNNDREISFRVRLRDKSIRRVWHSNKQIELPEVNVVGKPFGSSSYRAARRQGSITSENVILVVGSERNEYMSGTAQQ